VIDENEALDAWHEARRIQERRAAAK